MTRDEMIKAFEIITKKCDKIINSKDYVADDYTQNIVEDIGELCNKILDGKFGKISLPSNLDEAAEKYEEIESWRTEALKYPRKAAFKAGAKWMAEQLIQMGKKDALKEVDTDVSKEAKPLSEVFTVNGVSFKMVHVAGGTFTMGATPEQGSEIYDDENPAHEVTPDGFYIGETEVTQALWTAVMGSNPSYHKGDDYPVENVSWNDCQTFISKLNSLTGKSFRLPTEAEWEFAARGGNNSRGYKFAGSDNLSTVAWYWDNSGNNTHAVKTKAPNELGLYDMSGNVWEWCYDWYGSYSSSSQTNPRGASSGSSRVYRGGSCYSDAWYCRVSNRCSNTPSYSYVNLGLRLAQ